MIKLITKSILLISGFMFFAYSQASACDCMPHSMKEDFESVDFIIKGKILKIKDLEYSKIKTTLTYRLNPNYIDTAGYYVDIEISKEFKGSLPDKITITPAWTNCDFLFKKNSEHVIFGYTDSDGIHCTNICTKTFKINEKDMNQLKAILKEKN